MTSLAMMFAKKVSSTANPFAKPKEDNKDIKAKKHPFIASYATTSQGSCFCWLQPDSADATVGCHSTLLASLLYLLLSYCLKGAYTLPSHTNAHPWSSLTIHQFFPTACATSCPMHNPLHFPHGTHCTFCC